MARVMRLLGEFDDPEQSYRRRFYQGAATVVEAILEKLPENNRAILEAWLQEVQEWRLEGTHGESFRASGSDLFPPGVRPPREVLERLKAG